MKKNFQPCAGKTIDLKGEYNLAFDLDFIGNLPGSWHNIFRITGGTQNLSGPNDR